MATKGYLMLLGGMREIERILKERMHEEEESIQQNGVPLLVESMADQIDELKEQLAKLNATPSGDSGLREALEAAAKSLRFLSRADSKYQPLLDTLQNVREYAQSRAMIAESALGRPAEPRP